jgi:type III pantothenate kinase
VLLIDSGNSAIKCRELESGICTDKYFPIYADTELHEFQNYLQSLSTDKIYLASVSIEGIKQKIINLIKVTGVPFEEIKSLPELGRVKNNYEDFSQLGVDRWLTLVASYDLSNTDVVIIDAGTAIKIELLSCHKGFLGGAILAGFNTNQERFKALFPAIDFNHPDINNSTLPGRSTMACINNQFPVTIGLINKILLDWLCLLERPVTVLLCGKDAGLLENNLQLEHQVVSDLVFKGMLKQIQLLE